MCSLLLFAISFGGSNSGQIAGLLLDKYAMDAPLARFGAALLLRDRARLLDGMSQVLLDNESHRTLILLSKCNPRIGHFLVTTSIDLFPEMTTAQKLQVIHWIFAELGPDASMSAGLLVECFSKDEFAISMAAVKALVAIGDASVGPLTQQLDSGSPFQKQLSCRALGMIGKKASSAIPKIKLLTNDEHLQLRLEARKAVDRIFLISK